MPFQPGHPHYPSRNGATGKRAAHAAAERDVALILHEQGCGQRILMLFAEACLTGIDPVTKESIDWSHRVAMGREVNDRQFGKPAQHLQLDAHVQAQLAVQNAANRTRDPYELLTDEELLQAESTGRKLGIDPTRVIEAIAELPEGEGEDEP